MLSAGKSSQYFNDDQLLSQRLKKLSKKLIAKLYKIHQRALDEGGSELQHVRARERQILQGLFRKIVAKLRRGGEDSTKQSFQLANSSNLKMGSSFYADQAIKAGEMEIQQRPGGQINYGASQPKFRQTASHFGTGKRPKGDGNRSYSPTYHIKLCNEVDSQLEEDDMYEIRKAHSKV